MKSLNKDSNIVFLINDITAIGGTERMCSMIANELAKIGYQVSVISHFEKNSSAFFTLDDKVKRYQLFNHAKKSIDHFQLPYKIFKKIKTLNPDIIISCDTQMCCYSTLALIGKNHIAWEHFNSEISTFLGSRWFGRRLASIFCKKIVVLTDDDKAHWIKSLQVKASKVTVIPNPLPINRIENIEPTKNHNVVLSVGRMTAQKGFDLLIHAWKNLNPKTKANWKLRIVGPNGSAKPELINMINKYQLNEQVELISESTTIEDEYQNASIYVMSSRYEGFGLTLIEAMSQGLPVISFDCPMGPNEILADKFGKLIPQEDVVQLTNALDNFMTNQSLRTEYAKLAYQRSEEYSTDKIISLWNSMLHQF